MTKTTYPPSILQYIPFFFVIWSDDLLTISEISIIKRIIDEDQNLSKENRETLNSWLNTSKPPLNSVIKSWQRAISNSGVKLTESDNHPLSSFSKKLLSQNGSEHLFNENLSAIEINLGIQPNHYQHLFEIEVILDKTSHFYNSKEIDKIFKGKYHIEINKFRDTLNDAVFTWRIIKNKEQFRLKVLSQVQYLAKKGYGAMAYPDTYGGIGNMPLYASIFENLMYIDGSLTVKFGVQFGLFGGSIQKLGTKKHHDLYLKAVGEAKLLGCFAMTETGHGSNVRGIKTTATYNMEEDNITIHTPGKNDNKEYIGNALHGTMASVFAQLIVDGKNHGVHAILVPLRDSENRPMPGVRIEDNGYKLGLNGVDNGKIWFDQVKVPRENLLNKYGDIKPDGTYYSEIKNANKRFFTMLGTLVGGRICVAKGALGGAKMAIAIAVKYALQRRQFNDNLKIQEDLIMDYPSHQLRLTPAIAKTYVYQVTLDSLMETYSDDSITDKRKIETQVAGLKAIITWFANQTIQECREACGGKGYLLENRIGDLKCDVDIFTTFEGDNTVLLQLAAKGIMSDFNTELNSGGFSAVFKLLGSQISDKLVTINPMYANKVDKEHLYNPKFHQHAFDYRTRRLTYSAAMRIRDYIKKGVPTYQAYLKVQTHLIALGKAYSCELAYNTYLKFTATMEDRKHQELFQKLGCLFALSEIREDASWFLEQGYLGGTKSKAIRQRVERLSTEFRPHIEVLVDGFGIPDHCLTAPISR
ncbi:MULTISPECIES: acyl-CoA dehydrogenase [unclassified Arenibacter]|uniref:acyl-CoA dehydrogenase family protein n=1 Tax=unclassified Arenibacter TaxID=2615047 RepID=UPI000E353440|nr:MULTISPECIES: acyl-CoA dehydrogenase [unclassified Arenibacter]MCM4162691.1 acyl-CoA oxidase [Arenibacter sp. A80]RFT58256.1 acyl-CoA oxidase [Arenibacter sp. P308M17]